MGGAVLVLAVAERRMGVSQACAGGVRTHLEAPLCPLEERKEGVPEAFRLGEQGGLACEVAGPCL